MKMTEVETNKTFGSVDDFYISHYCTDESEKHFAQVVGFIEEILMDDDFNNKQNEFMEKYWHEFENTEENKFVYTEIFDKYVQNIEKYIENELLKNVPMFDMCKFEQELKNRHQDLDGEIFEILSTFTDFLAFKNMFLEYKEMKEGKMVDFSQDFTVTKYKVENDL